MPSQLLERLWKFLDQGAGPVGTYSQTSTHPLDQVMRHENDPRTDTLGPAPPNNPAQPGQPGVNRNPHWRAGSWGSRMTMNTDPTKGANNVSGVNTISIHETSGWPAYEGASNMVSAFLCLSDQTVWVQATPPTPAHWKTDSRKRGVGPQYYIDGNGTVFALVGEFNLGAEPRITIHTETVNATSIGIENGDAGDAAGIRPQNAANGPYWFRLSTGQTEDMPGLAVFALLHPASDQADLGLIWFATQARGAAIPNYPGSGDTNTIATRYSHWDNMIFTERDYRSLALLARLLAEQYGVPRNFCILPYSKGDSDGGDRDILRKLILADERQDMVARKCGLTAADIQNKTNAYTSQNNSTLWYRFFGVKPGASPAAELPGYRGFIAHALIASLGHFACPGPLFDWHRFSREVWDWWWYPFDLNIAVPALYAQRRPYMQARGDTLLREYYYDAAEPGADFTTIGDRFNALGVADLDASRGANHFAIHASTPIYAMANGVVVAARLTNPASAASPAYVLVRHEVFYRTNATTNAVDYDHTPAVVWSLTTYLNCTSFNYTQISTDNPDWLNRLLLRLKECELAVTYKAAHPGDNANSAQYQGNATQFAYDQRFQKAWNFAPTSTGPRPSSGTGIQDDATEYRRIVTDLQANNYVLFPLEKSPSITPVRVILGDFLGTCGTLPSNADGVQTQIFSKDLLPLPLPVPAQPSDPAPPAPQAQALAWANEDWWKKASATNRDEGTPERNLPANASVYSYSVTKFLDWINKITWQSEWRKYEVVDATATSVATPARPRTRLGL